MQHRPLMQGVLGLKTPHGPWTISSSTALWVAGSCSISGNSAIMILSTSTGNTHIHVGCSQSRMWAWGSPHFWNSIVYIPSERSIKRIQILMNQTYMNKTKYVFMNWISCSHSMFSPTKVVVQKLKWHSQMFKTNWKKRKLLYEVHSLY